MTGTMKDVARRAGVSTATVSRVLAGITSVDTTLRRQVLEAVEALDYQPVRVARTLRRRKSSILGVIISDIQNPFFTSLVRAVEDRASQADLAVLLCNSDEDAKKEAMYVDVMLAERAAGVVICPAMESDNSARKLLAAGVPVVCVDRRMLDLHVDTVVIDNEQAAHELVTHLIRDGHRRIGALLGPSLMTTGRERLAGYLSALSDEGIPPDESLITAGQPTEERGYALARELLGHPHPPTAIFAGNNLLAIGALRAARERRLRIPQDLGIAAFDNTAWSTIVDPPLTVVEQPTYELGSVGTDMLLDRMKDTKRAPREMVLRSTIRIRGSCGPHTPTPC